MPTKKVTLDPTMGSIFICAKTQNPIVSEKSQLCPIAPKFFLVGSWVIKDPTGNRMSSKWTYLLPFRSYGQKTTIFSCF